MSEERKLRLVPPVPSDGDPAGAGRGADDEDAPPTAEELAEAEALRVALDHAGAESGDALANALRAAWAPEELTAVDQEALLARALGDDPIVAPATRVEAAAADLLARELDAPPLDAGSRPFQLAEALRAAHAPASIDGAAHERIVGRALAQAAKSGEGARVVSLAEKREGRAAATGASGAKRRRIGVTMAALSSAVAAAAVLMLFVRFNPSADRSASDAASRRAEAPAPMAAASAAPAAAAPAATAAPPAAAERREMASAGAAHAAKPAAQAKGRGADGPEPAKNFGGGLRKDAPPAVAAAPQPAAPVFAEPPSDVAPTRAAAEREAAPTTVAGFIPVRSTDGLFGAEPFPRSGGESSRIDRIAMARAADLRQNRFAAWGVR